MVALKARYCDSAYRETVTDTLRPTANTSEQGCKPPDDPKADRCRCLPAGSHSNLIDTTDYLDGDVLAATARLFDRVEAYSVSPRWSSPVEPKITLIWP